MSLDLRRAAIATLVVLVAASGLVVCTSLAVDDLDGFPSSTRLVLAYDSALVAILAALAFVEARRQSAAVAAVGIASSLVGGAAAAAASLDVEDELMIRVLGAAALAALACGFWIALDRVTAPRTRSIAARVARVAFLVACGVLLATCFASRPWLRRAVPIAWAFALGATVVAGLVGRWPEREPAAPDPSGAGRPRG
jgi:hypothetical protein